METSSTTKVCDLPPIIKVAYDSDIPLLFSGYHGVGKSQIFEQTAAEMGIGFIVLDLSVIEPVDLLGLPVIEDGCTVYAPPAILPTDGRGLLLLEELNRAPAPTRTPALELCTRRAIHNYRLPDGWLPCAAVNPSGGEYSVDSLDPAFLSRFITLRVVADQESWVRWARREKLHRVVVEYVEQCVDIFSNTNIDPRSLDYASKALETLELQDYDSSNRDVLLAIWSGLLGEEIAVAMMRFMESAEKPLSAATLLKDYASLRPIVMQSVNGARIDLIRSTTLKIKRYLKSQRRWNSLQEDERQSRNLEAFLADIPPDLRQDFLAWLDEKGYQWPLEAAS